MVPYLGYGGNEEEREVNHWFYCVKNERRDEDVVGEEATPASISRRGPGRRMEVQERSHVFRGWSRCMSVLWVAPRQSWWRPCWGWKIAAPLTIQ